MSWVPPKGFSENMSPEEFQRLLQELINTANFNQSERFKEQVRSATEAAKRHQERTASESPFSQRWEENPYVSRPKYRPSSSSYGESASQFFYDNYRVRTGQYHQGDPTRPINWEHKDDFTGQERSTQAPPKSSQNETPVMKASKFLSQHSEVPASEIISSPKSMRSSFAKASQKIRPDLTENHDQALELLAAYQTMKSFHGLT